MGKRGRPRKSLMNTAVEAVMPSVSDSVSVSGGEVLYKYARRVVLRCVNGRCVRNDLNYIVQGSYVVPMVHMCVYCGGEMEVELK